MSWQASAWAQRKKAGTASRKAVLFAIAENMAPHEGILGGFHCGFPGQELIAGGAEMTTRALRPHLEELEARGLLRRFPRFRPDGKRSSDWYVLPIRTDGAEATAEEFAALRDPREPSPAHRTNRPVEASSGGSRDTPPPEVTARHHRKPASEYPLVDPLEDPLKGMPERRTIKGRATEAPDGMIVTPSMQAWALAHGIHVNLERETERFLNTARANARKYKDWTAAWRTWMSRAEEYAAERRPRAAQDARPEWLRG